MKIPVTITLVYLACGAFGADPVVAPGVANPLNPYYAGRNPLNPGYNPYYNSAGPAIPILSYSSTQGIDGSYDFSFTTADGKQAQESGFLKDAYIDNTGAPQGTQVKEGSFSYVSPEGTPIQLNYVADENGFRPAGFHIPADGRGVVPAPFLDRVKGSQVYDPRYNLYDPYNRNRVFGQLNSNRPYDPRYSYDPRYNSFIPYRPSAYNNIAKEVKKSSS